MTNLINRKVPILSGTTALLVIDVQNGIYNEDQSETRPFFYEQATSRVIPNIADLVKTCRAADIEVIYTTIESLTRDGRDRSLDYKITGFNFSKGSWESQVIPQVQPVEDEIVIPKTSSSLFNSTNFEYVLRNIGISQIMVTGFLTDQCIDHTIRDGADLGFLMICVEDACTTETQKRHETALNLFKGYCSTVTTQEILDKIATA